MIDELEKRTKAEQAYDRTRDELDGARLRLAPLDAQRAAAREASQRFRSTLVEVYKDPVAARREFHAAVQRHGVTATAVAIAHHPERFGNLRGTQLGPMRSAERLGALRAAPRLERLGAETVYSTREAWASRAEYRAARAAVKELSARVKTLDAEITQGRGSTQLRRRLGRELQALRPAERQVLRRSLPIPYRQVLTAAMAAAQAFVREQGHER